MISVFVYNSMSFHHRKYTFTFGEVIFWKKVLEINHNYFRLLNVPFSGCIEQRIYHLWSVGNKGPCPNGHCVHYKGWFKFRIQNLDGFLCMLCHLQAIVLRFGKPDPFLHTLFEGEVRHPAETSDISDIWSKVLQGYDWSFIMTKIFLMYSKTTNKFDSKIILRNFILYW